MTRGAAYAAGLEHLRQLRTPEHVVREVLLHPRRCAPDFDTFALITQLPLPVALTLWGT